MKKFDIKVFIDFVIDLVNEFSIFSEEDYDAKFYFASNGCYELYKLVKHYFPTCKCLIKNDLKHCAILYNGEVFDVDGKIEDICDYRIASVYDMQYLETTFKTDVSELKCQNLVNEIDKCRVKGVLCE